MYRSIKEIKDIKRFLDDTNALHDGYVIGVQYANEGIARKGKGLWLDSEQTKLCLKVLVTSIYDTVVEIVFENLVEWQIKDNQWEIAETAVVFCEKDCIIWSDNAFTNDDELKEGSYVIAKSMKWRIVE